MANSKIVRLNNRHLESMDGDYLYHINILVPKDTQKIEEQFGDVRFICTGGTGHRMKELALYLRDVLNIDDGEELKDLAESGHRYAMFKVGPVLCVSHGLGMDSMSVVLHELFKLVKYAKCNDPVFIRVGTSGGLGVEPGTVVVTHRAFNGYLNNEYVLPILGKEVKRPAYFDENVVNDLVNCSDPTDNFKVIKGNTMSANCFYEGQGRLDGASCDYTLDDKMRFLQKCHEKGVRNIEMESTMFSSLALVNGVRAVTVCVTLVNRLLGDQVMITPEQKAAFEQSPLTVVGRYIKKNLLIN